MIERIRQECPDRDLQFAEQIRFSLFWCRDVNNNEKIYLRLHLTSLTEFK